MELRTPDESDTFGSGTHLVDPNAHFVVRDCHGNYRARMVRDNSITPIPTMVSVRTLAVSPFADDPPGTVYAGGFDANNTKVHNSAWLYRGTPYEPTDN